MMKFLIKGILFILFIFKEKSIMINLKFKNNIKSKIKKKKMNNKYSNKNNSSRFNFSNYNKN
jgi:hypothetical protein